MPRFIAKLGLVAVALLFPLLIQAQTGEDCYNKGNDYYDGKNGVSKNINEAVKWFKKGADQGHAKCINAMGVMYKNGTGVTKNLDEAIKCYKRAAEMGLDKAQSNLADMYNNGEGVPKDLAEAAKWYRKAAEQGHARAQNGLGYALLNGYGVTKDYNEAIQWFRKSAEQNFVYGQSNLGLMYEMGYGTEKNYAEAVKWYKKAAEQGNAWSQNRLGNLYIDDEGPGKDYNEAFKWYMKAAEQNHSAAQTSVGYMYENGYGVAQNYAKAVEYYHKAAENGNASAQRNMGIMYEKGIGVDIDYAEAIKWFNKALKTNPNYAKVKTDIARVEKKQNSSASEEAESEAERLFNKGVDYYIGRNGVKKDYAQAFTYFKQVADKGLASAQHNVGYFYDKGYGVKQNCVEAVKWYKLAAEQGWEESICGLAQIYQFGRPGVTINNDEAIKWYLKVVNLEKPDLRPEMVIAAYNNLGALYDNKKDYAEALKWFRKAAERNSPDAQYNLGNMFGQGNGVTKDEIEAAKWYHRAAEQGHAGAQYNLGCIYRDGEGVKQDFAESNKWYLKAANQGHAEAQNSIGFSYLRGRGGYAQDYQKAMEWFQKAANKGDANAMNNIGVCYLDGEGVARDLDKAEEWFKKALKVDPKDESAKENLEKARGRRSAITYTYNPNAKPILEFVENSISFVDPSGKNTIKAGGKYKIKLQVKNVGDAAAKDLLFNVYKRGSSDGISFEKPKIEEIKAGGTKNIEILVTANERTKNGQVEISIETKPSNGYGTGEKYLILNTQGVDEPMVRITDYSLTAESGKVLKKKEAFDLQLMLQNIDLGQADDVSVELELPAKVLMLDGEESVSFPKLTGGEVRSLVYSLIVRNDYADPIIPIIVHVKEKTGKHAQDRTISLTLDQSYASAKLSTKNFRDGHGYDVVKATSDVDQNIPTTKRTQNKTFALIIANENYEEVDPVPFAANDGAMFKAYCQQTLGIPEENVHSLSDATLGKMRRQVEWLQEVAQAYGNEARIIVYYAGHGIPDEKDKTAYLLPVDGFGRDVKTALPLNEFYSTLAKLSAKSVTVFLDACFSGAKREGNMLVAARGVAIKVKQTAPEGNLVVFSAAQGDETAHPFTDQQHGMFTYYLLKKLKESKAELTMGELTDYVRQQVMQQSMKRNGKMQTPTVVSSSALSNTWKEMKLK